VSSQPHFSTNFIQNEMRGFNKSITAWLSNWLTCHGSLAELVNLGCDLMDIGTLTYEDDPHAVLLL
jgi:hypothetical protein